MDHDWVPTELAWDPVGGPMIDGKHLQAWLPLGLALCHTQHASNRQQLIGMLGQHFGKR